MNIIFSRKTRRVIAFLLAYIMMFSAFAASGSVSIAKETEENTVKTKTMYNLMVFARFSDEDEFIGNTMLAGHTRREIIDNTYNASSYSMKEYYKSVSNGTLNLQTIYLFADDNFSSFKLSHTRGYYSPKSDLNPEGYEGTGISSGRWYEWLDDWGNKVQDTLEAGKKPCLWDGQGNPMSLDDLDYNNDGYIDSISLIYSKADANGPYSASQQDILWAYQGINSRISLNTGNKTITSHRFSQSTLQFEEQGLYQDTAENGRLFLSPATTIHETGHVFGLQDLYYIYDQKGMYKPVYYMSVMAKPLSPVAQFMTCYEREVMGWLDDTNINSISSNGSYDLVPLSDSSQPGVISYKIKVPDMNNTWLYMEYRYSENETINRFNADSSHLKIYDVNGANVAKKMIRPSKSGLLVYVVNTRNQFPSNVDYMNRIWDVDVLGGTKETRSDAPRTTGESVSYKGITINVNNCGEDKISFSVDGLKGNEETTSEDKNSSEAKDTSVDSSSSEDKNTTVPDNSSEDKNTTAPNTTSEDKNTTAPNTTSEDKNTTSSNTTSEDKNNTESNNTSEDKKVELYQDIPQVQITVDSTENLNRSSYITAQITITDEETHTTTFSDQQGKIKIRGNSTAYLDKLPYNIKFSSEQSVLGMSAGKKWCLLANRMDKSLMRNKLAYDFAHDLNLEYAVSSRYVDVWLNGTYQGNYLMTTPVETGVNRLHIDTTQNEYLLEVESYRDEEGVEYVTSPIYGIRLALNDPEQMTDSQKEYIHSFLSKVDNALESQSPYEICKYIDVSSVVDMYILQELFKNLDANDSSTRFYIKDNKLYAGPVWDFDMSAGNENAFTHSNKVTSPEGYYAVERGWINELLKQKDCKEYYCYRYKQLHSHILHIFEADDKGNKSHIDELLDSYQAPLLRDSDVAGWSLTQTGDMERIPESTYGQNVAFLQNWLMIRDRWLFENLNCEDAKRTYSLEIAEPEYLCKDASCTESASYYYSSIDGKCGQETFTVGQPLGHDYSDWTVTKAPTCEQSGIETCTCRNCGKTETREIPATGHDYGDWTVTKAPTCEQSGIETRTCRNCGKTETREIPALGLNDNTSQTGNESQSENEYQSGNVSEADGKNQNSEDNISAEESRNDLSSDAASPQTASQSTIVDISDFNEIESMTIKPKTTFHILKFRMKKTTANSQKLCWSKTKNADGYLLYGCTSDKNSKFKLINSINKNQCNWTRRNLKSGKYYKYYLVAYKVVNGKKVAIAISKTIYSATIGGKYTNVSSIRINKTKLSLKKGKKYKLKTKITKHSKRLLLKKYSAIRFEVSDNKIASVSSNGTIKAKRKGICNLYAYAQNGLYKKIKLIVK